MEPSKHTNGINHSSNLKEGAEPAESWHVRASRESHHCINPVRSCEEEVFVEALRQRNPDKELIKLSIGEWGRTRGDGERGMEMQGEGGAISGTCLRGERGTVHAYFLLCHAPTLLLFVVVVFNLICHICTYLRMYVCVSREGQ